MLPEDLTVIVGARRWLNRQDEVDCGPMQAAFEARSL